MWWIGLVDLCGGLMWCIDVVEDIRQMIGE